MMFISTSDSNPKESYQFSIIVSLSFVAFSISIRLASGPRH